MRAMRNEKGATLIEVAITSLLTVTIILAVGSVTAQTNRKLFSETDRIEMQEKGRAIMDIIATYGRATGADRAGIFSNAPYTTTSVMPIPQASSTMMRLRSDYDDNGALATTLPEDITVSWTSGTKTLVIGSSTFSNISNFVIRYYDSSGAQLAGTWNIAASAADGPALRSIARIQVEVELEARHTDPTTNQLAHETLLWDVAVRNQLTTL